MLCRVISEAGREGRTRSCDSIGQCGILNARTLDEPDLLPDLPGQSCCKCLDLVHGAEYHFITEVLHEQGSQLAVDRKELAAIVEIPAQLRRRHRSLRR